MNRGKSILALLVAAALAWAYVATHRPGPTGGGPDAQVSVWQVQPDAIGSVVYRDGGRQITLVPDWSQDQDEPFIWVDAATPDAAPGAPPKPGERKTPPALGAFKGNAVAQSTLLLLADLRAKRLLGRAEALELARYDLAESRRYVELVFADGRPPWRLDFGRATPGNALRYVRTHTNDSVYLVRENLVNGLLGDGRRLFDNQLFPFSPATAGRIEIDHAGRTQHLYQVTGPDRRRKGWAARADAQEGDPLLGEIASRIARLLADRYAPRDEKLPQAANLEVRLYKDKEEGGRSESAWLKVFSGGDETELALSSHTRHPVHVKVESVNEVLGALRKLLKAH